MVEVANAARGAPETGVREVFPGTTAGRPLARLDEIATANWQTLAAQAIEPNGYYLPDWALAANGSRSQRAATKALTAVDATGRLIGLLPVISSWQAWRLPLPVLVSADPYRSLDTPLLDGGASEQAAGLLIARARSSGAHALVLRLITLDGPAANAFSSALASEGLRPRLLNSHARASLDATRDPDVLLREALGGKKLKDLRRLRARLAEQGAVSFAVARSPGEVAAAFDMFLALEASGWKGARGTALAGRTEDAARLRQAAIALAGRGQCEIASLHTGDTAVAAGLILRHQDRAFFFKIGIDQRFAKFSPGVQLTLDLTRHLCADPRIASADSTAAAGHPMIDPIWRGRLAIGDWFIPLRRHDPLMPLLYGAVRARQTARDLAVRLLRR